MCCGEESNYPVFVNGVNVAATSPFTSNLAMCCGDEERTQAELSFQDTE